MRPRWLTFMDQRPVSFGGVWDCWTDRETGELIESYSIITWVLNGVTGQTHDLTRLIIEPGRLRAG